MNTRLTVRYNPANTENFNTFQSQKYKSLTFDETQKLEERNSSFSNVIKNESKKKSNT